MRFQGRLRIVVTSMGMAAISILYLAATVIADSGPVPFPK
jgi:hypothetical protein